MKAWNTGRHVPGGMLMKAIVCEKYGSPDVLKLKEVEKPVPEKSELLIRIFATTVSSGDMRVRSASVPPVFWLPFRLYMGLTGPRRRSYCDGQILLPLEPLDLVCLWVWRRGYILRFCEGRFWWVWNIFTVWTGEYKRANGFNYRERFVFYR